MFSTNMRKSPQYMAGGCVDDFLTRMNDAPASDLLLAIASQTASGMGYLQRHNIIHRDLVSVWCVWFETTAIIMYVVVIRRCEEKKKRKKQRTAQKFGALFD